MAFLDDKTRKWVFYGLVVAQLVFLAWFLVDTEANKASVEFKQFGPMLGQYHKCVDKANANPGLEWSLECSLNLAGGFKCSCDSKSIGVVSWKMNGSSSAR
jgi:hypothetical protein